MIFFVLHYMFLDTHFYAQISSIVTRHFTPRHLTLQNDSYSSDNIEFNNVFFRKERNLFSTSFFLLVSISAK